MAHLFFNYWKIKEDLSALRDSVSQLREVEKIFTSAQFPEFWADVQGELGYLLSLLGNMTRSTDICLLAINSYQNQQKILSEKRAPLTWASSQESIGNLHYKIGTEHHSRDHLEDALECFHDALYIYENVSREDKIKQLLLAISKTDNELRGI
jgi:tetratricopeptide (TPR) repeat protein